jgi:hypothetical protein
MYSGVMHIALNVVLFPGLLLAQDVRLELTEVAVPEAVSQEASELIGKKSCTISIDDQVAAHFWFREDPLVALSPSSELAVTFGQLQSGSLMGVVHLVQSWSDYKENSIQSGVYTMRYGVMPADGNHMGVSPYRDYLLLIPAAEDTDPEGVLSYVELVGSSMLATGAPHPAVLALFPVWEEISEPKLTKNEMDQWTIAVKFGDQVLGVVVAGRGEI